VKRFLKSLRGNRVVGLGWIAGLVLIHPALFAFAALPGVGWFTAAIAFAYVAEHHAMKRAPLVLTALGRMQISITSRHIAREAALLVLVARADAYEISTFATLAIGVLLLHMLRGAILGLRQYITKRRALPVETRNVDLSDVGIPDAPPRILMRGGIRRPLWLVAPAAVGVLLDLAFGLAVLGLAGLGVGLVAGVAATIALLRHALRVRHLGNRKLLFQKVHQKVLAYRPEVALYYSSGQDTAYQVNMWLSTLSNLDRRPIIIVRERAHLAKIARTPIPIICLVGGSDVMDFDLPDLKVILYVGNVGKNVHMLRNSRAKHVFIGHGDSDKVASANPASRVYDEVWVAGRAGRDRYRRARVGVRDEAIVEVGRPQLAEVEPADAHTRPMFTVLYAPTFEGWSNDMYLSSVHVLGEQIIRALLARTPEVRVIYKPHPLTGVRNPAVREAHKTIMRMLAEANQARLAGPRWARTAAESEPERKAARLLMTELDARMRELRGGRRPTDAAQRARDNGAADLQVQAELEACETRWRKAYWEAAGWWTHLTVTGSRPHLYSCFNQADLLISDISSVVSDFVASGKPYVVTNLEDVDETQFRAEQTAAGGAYLLGTDCAELDSILATVQTPGADLMADRRRETQTYLLGPAEPDAMTRFNAAVEALAEKCTLEQAVTDGGDAPVAQFVEHLIPRPRSADEPAGEAITARDTNDSSSVLN